jgi:hypothetical protein
MSAGKAFLRELFVRSLVDAVGLPEEKVRAARSREELGGLLGERAAGVGGTVLRSALGALIDGVTAPASVKARAEDPAPEERPGAEPLRRGDDDDESGGGGVFGGLWGDRD